MKIKIGIAAIFVCLALSGCEKKFDTSTDEKFRASSQAIRSSLPENEREKFDRSVLIVLMNGVGLADMTSESLKARMATFDGKTAGQVMLEADGIIAVRKEQERKQAFQEIAELKKRKEQASEDLVALKKVEVSRSRFFIEYNEYTSMGQPHMEVALRNGTTHAISRVFAVGTISTPGRSVPWLMEDFNFSISGGIEPGENHESVLSPNMFSEWGRVSVPADAIFTVEVVGIETSGGLKISSTSFSDQDNKRLAELEKSFPVP